MNGEETIREDERQACWEDFVQTLITYGGPMKILLGRILEAGWKDLGTGDGKPQHRLKDSEVKKWLEMRQRKV
jgi:hypothetical protein